MVYLVFLVSRSRPCQTLDEMDHSPDTLCQPD